MADNIYFDMFQFAEAEHSLIYEDARKIYINVAGDVLYLAGTATTGNRTLAQNGIATAVKTKATTWSISGVGLT